MLPAASFQNDNLLIDMYDKYSPVLYGLLVQLMDTRLQAEAVLGEVFEKVHRNNLYAGQSYCTAGSLFRLTVITACRRQFNPADFLEKFNSLPRLHRLLIGNINLKTFKAELPPFPGIYGKEIALELNSFIRANHPASVQVNN